MKQGKFDFILTKMDEEEINFVLKGVVKNKESYSPLRKDSYPNNYKDSPASAENSMVNSLSHLLEENYKP